MIRKWGGRPEGQNGAEIVCLLSGLLGIVKGLQGGGKVSLFLFHGTMKQDESRSFLFAGLRDGSCKKRRVIYLALSRQSNVAVSFDPY